MNGEQRWGAFCPFPLNGRGQPDAFRAFRSNGKGQRDAFGAFPLNGSGQRAARQSFRSNGRNQVAAVLRFDSDGGRRRVALPSFRLNGKAQQVAFLRFQSQKLPSRRRRIGSRDTMESSWSLKTPQEYPLIPLHVRPTTPRRKGAPTLLASTLALLARGPVYRSEEVQTPAASSTTASPLTRQNVALLPGASSPSSPRSSFPEAPR